MRSVMLAVLLAIAVAGCDVGGGDGDESAVDKAQFVAELVLPFQEDVEPLGRVGLSAAGGAKTRIVIELDDPPEPILRAEIRRGACNGPFGLGVEYVLDDLEDGKAQTVIDVPLRDLRRAGYIIVIRRLSQESEVDGFCGDLTNSEEQ